MIDITDLLVNEPESPAIIKEVIINLRGRIEF